MLVFGSIFSFFALAVGTNPLPGVYNERGIGDLWLLQLTIKDGNIADLEFILNNECGKKGFEFPKMWKIKNMDFTVNNSTITFLTQKNDTHRPEIIEMNRFFGDFGQIVPPLNATIMKDGSLTAVILKLVTNLQKTEKLDMDAEFKEMHDKHYNERPKPIDAVSASAVNKTTHANAASMSSMVLAAPLALGMLDWLWYL